MGYIDDYKLLMIATLAVTPLLLFFSRPPVEAGADHAMAVE
jgi:hypothetical protein